MSDNRIIEKRNDDSLSTLIDGLILDLTKPGSPIREGVVMTPGPAAYRRLDCDSRALAYVRARPRKRLVRVDISGLWLAPKTGAVGVRYAAGPLGLVIKNESDRRAAVEYLTSIVVETRAAWGDRCPKAGRAHARAKKRDAAGSPVPALEPTHVTGAGSR